MRAPNLREGTAQTWWTDGLTEVRGLSTQVGEHDRSTPLALILLLGEEEGTMSHLHPKPDRYLSEVYCDYPLALGRCDHPRALSRIFAVLHRRNASLAIE